MRLDGLWRDHDFVRLWSASTISVFGTLITTTALPFTAILVLGASPSLVGWLRLAELLPGFVVGLVAGAWLDRRRRRPVMVAADLARAAILLSVPVAALTGSLGFPHLLAVAAGMSVLGVVFDVAWQAHLPGVVGRARLVEANSKVTAAWSVAEAASFSVGGWLVQLLTAPIAVAVDAATFVASALCLRGMRTPERDPAAERDPGHRSSLSGDAVEGVRIVWADRRLRALAVANLGMAVSFGTGGAAFLIYVNQVLGFGPGVLGLIFALGGVSSFVGAIVAGRIAFLPIGPVMITCFVAAAVGTALAPLATSAGVIGVSLLVAQQFVSDPAWTILDINTVSLRQAVTADEALGRVNATFRVGDVGGQMVGTLVGGYVGDAFGARAALWVGVAALLVAAVWLAVSPVRNLRSLPTGEQVGAAG